MQKFSIFLIDEPEQADRSGSKLENIMNGNFLIPPPLKQAFESGSGSSGPANEITRRSFLKRTGAASVATLVSWNSMQQQARATESNSGDDSSGSGSEWMCAVGPALLDTLVGGVRLAGGGYIFLYYQDTFCYQSIDRCHRKKILKSHARLRAEGWVPEKGDTAPWICYPQIAQNGAWEENDFTINNGQISRVGVSTLPLVTEVRYVMHLLDENDDEQPILSLCLEISDIIRSSSSVEIQGKAWFEGAVGERILDDTQFVSGFGLTLVAENAQPSHSPGNCQCAP